MKHHAVEFHNVSKLYGHTAAVDDISFTITPGTLLCLLGPSGCGKTTTLRMLAGLEEISKGRVLIGGRDVTGLSAADRNVSMVFQSYALFPHMNVLANVCYGLRSGGMKRAQAEEVARDKLAQVGLAGLEERLPGQLSGGQQQRVAVARAIVLEPEVLLFDEPLSNLDAKLRRRVRDEIRALQQQLHLTVVYVTHDQTEALAVSDRIIVMRAGRIAQDGTPRELYQEPANRFVADFIGDANLMPVQVRGLDATRAEASLGSLRLVVPRRGIADGAAELAVRPHALHLARPDEPALAAEVDKASYLGSHMEYTVRLEGLKGEFFVSDDDTEAPLPPGATTRIGIAASAVALVPPEPGAP